MNAARYYIIAFLIMAMALQILHKAGFIAYFKFNRAYIAERYCVNKDKPELECDGKCHLKKYLEAELELSEDNTEPPSQKLPNLDLFKNFNGYYVINYHSDEMIFSRMPVFLAGINTRSVFCYTQFKGRIYQIPIFRPPLV